jgi:FixJ family two-component response regulator
MNTDRGVYIVEDDALVRNALMRVISYAGYQVQGFGDGRDFLQCEETANTGCLLLDFSLPELSGIEVQEALIARHSEMPVIFMSGYADVPLTVRAMKLGAVDFLTKPVSETALLAAVQNALDLEENRRGQRVKDEDIRARMQHLTPRERDVLNGVLLGRLNKQIARALGISEKTVKVHRGRVMAKMGVRHVAHLAQLAAQIDYQPVDDFPVATPAVVALPIGRTRHAVAAPLRPALG